MSYCSSGNADGTEGDDGKMYLDGGCYVSTVKPEYPHRADAATTKRVLAELRDVKFQKRLKHLQRWGYYSWMSSGGDNRISVNCNPDPLPSNATDGDVPGRCVVVFNQDQYAFPFDPLEWVKPSWVSLEELKKLKSFASVVRSTYVPRVGTPWVRGDGSLARGQTCPEGRLCASRWNDERNDYDNLDLGPSNPVAWSVSGWGLSYDPLNPGDERRATPGKPWTLVVSYYGYPDQFSPGWTEKEAKDLLPQFLTGFSVGVQGQDYETMNRGNLRRAWCFEDGAYAPQGVALPARALPLAPSRAAKPALCLQGGSLAPGATCTMSVGGG